jgi:hypothetical protein
MLLAFFLQLKESANINATISLDTTETWFWTLFLNITAPHFRGFFHGFGAFSWGVGVKRALLWHGDRTTATERSVEPHPPSNSAQAEEKMNKRPLKAGFFRFLEETPSY